MTKLVVLFALVVSSTTFAADLTETCLYRYRDATLNLLDAAEAYNNGDYSKSDFLAEYAVIQSEVLVKRAMCTFEPHEIKECVMAYKERYVELKSRISSLSIAKGYQDEVEKLARIKMKIGFTDLKCLD